MGQSLLKLLPINAQSGQCGVECELGMRGLLVSFVQALDCCFLGCLVNGHGCDCLCVRLARRFEAIHCILDQGLQLVFDVQYSPGGENPGCSRALTVEERYVTSKSNIVLGAFTDLLQANSFRMPINEPTALDPWWNSYKAAIDAGIAKGMKVIIGFWAKDKGIGKPVDNTRWYAMWKVVIDAYVSNPLVFYDIHNEPHGFTPAQWITQVNGWIAQFPNVPRQQIIVAGSGWDDNVGNVASSWPDLMMEIHNYAYNGPTTTAGWKSNLLNRLGNAVSRTIAGEWAGQVVEDYTTGIEGNADKSFIVGTANTILENKMGSCWWAGAFAPSGGTSGTTLLIQKGTGDTMTFTVNNQATLTYVQHSWGLN